MRLFGISGKAGAGKTLFAKHAIEKFGGTKIALADAVKEECGKFLEFCLVPFHTNNLYGSQDHREQRFSVLLCDWLQVPYNIRRVFNQHMKIDGDTLGMTYRQLMQLWGTDYRRAQDPDYWVKKAKAKIDATEGLIFIDDVRFESEAWMILNNGGAVIRVDRPGGPRISTPWHASECGLDDFLNFTMHLDNDQDEDHYKGLVERAMRFLL